MEYLRFHFGLQILKKTPIRHNNDPSSSVRLIENIPPSISSLKKTILTQPEVRCDFVTVKRSLCVAVRTMRSHGVSIETLLVNIYVYIPTIDYSLNVIVAKSELLAQFLALKDNGGIGLQIFVASTDVDTEDTEFLSSLANLVVLINRYNHTPLNYYA